MGTRQNKYSRLTAEDIQTTHWDELIPQTPSYLFTPQDMGLRAEYEQGWKITDAMTLNSAGIVTARGHLTIGWSEQEVLDTVRDFAFMPAEEARAKYKLGVDVRDCKVALAQKDIKDHGVLSEKVVPILYRPFDRRKTYYTGRSRGFICMPRPEVMHHILALENIALVCPRRVETSGTWQHFIIASGLVEHVLVSLKTIDSVFPLYLYPHNPGSANTQASMTGLSPWPEGKDGRHPNLNPDFVADLQHHVSLTFISNNTSTVFQNRSYLFLPPCEHLIA